MDTRPTQAHACTLLLLRSSLIRNRKSLLRLVHGTSDLDEDALLLEPLSISFAKFSFSPYMRAYDHRGPVQPHMVLVAHRCRLPKRHVVQARLEYCFVGYDVLLVGFVEDDRFVLASFEIRQGDVVVLLGCNQ